MKAFDYRAPETLDEAITLLAAGGDRARPLAGGTDLIVQLRNGRFELETLVDIKRLPELNSLSYDSAAGLTIGAAVPVYRVYEDHEISAAYPGLIDAVARIGGIAVQGRATIGGNLCNSSPSGDSIPAMIVLAAICKIAGPAGIREIPVEEFCTGPGRNVLGRGELLVSLRFPLPPPRSGAHYLRFIPRNEMDVAVVGVGAAVVLSDDLSKITAARIALGAVAPTPLFVEAAGACLVGIPVSE
ncbi:MAG: FAD binding domain-containing protein, partial [Dehalococcoidia bacterium]|nr:FAD binding domain-containing protein [Dehalococcoidia bacterium]